MIELLIRGGDDTARQEEPTYLDGDYAGHNRLGRTVSGRDYAIGISNTRPGYYAATFSPLLRVNSEARNAVLKFYRVHLPYRPFKHKDRGQHIFLNPEYDILNLTVNIEPLPALADFLHDVRAYDPKDQGVAHLAMTPEYFIALFYPTPPGPEYRTPLCSPAIMHPIAAASFADILRSKLRSVLCIISFGTWEWNRGMTAHPVAAGPEWRSHFAQTLPLHPRQHVLSAFRWLDTDPRKDVNLDLGKVPIDRDLSFITRDWTRMERGFGVNRIAEDDKLRLYICPSNNWPRQHMPQEEHLPKGSRQIVERHLCEEAETWLHGRECSSSSLPPPHHPLLRHGTVATAKDFVMETAPNTAIGMWLFPADAFKTPTRNYQRGFIDVSTAFPGLLLFDI